MIPERYKLVYAPMEDSDQSVHPSSLISLQWPVLPAKSDSDEILCLQLQSKTLTCTLHLS